MNHNKRMSKSLAPSGAHILVGEDAVNTLNVKQGEGQSVQGVVPGEGSRCLLEQQGVL